MPKVEDRDLEPDSKNIYDPNNILDVKLDDMVLMNHILGKTLDEDYSFSLQDVNDYVFIELGAAQTSQYGRPSMAVKFRDLFVDFSLRRKRRKSDDVIEMMDVNGHISHYFAAYADDKDFPEYKSFDLNVTKDDIAKKVTFLDLLALGQSVHHYPIKRKELRERLQHQTLESYNKVIDYAHSLIEQKKLPIIFSHHVLPVQELDYSTVKVGHKTYKNGEKTGNIFLKKPPASNMPLGDIPGLHYHVMDRFHLVEAINKVNRFMSNEHKIQPFPNSEHERDLGSFNLSLHDFYSMKKDLFPVGYRRNVSAVGTPLVAFTWGNDVDDFKKSTLK